MSLSEPEEETDVRVAALPAVAAVDVQRRAVAGRDHGPHEPECPIGLRRARIAARGHECSGAADSA